MNRFCLYWALRITTALCAISFTQLAAKWFGLIWSWQLFAVCFGTYIIYSFGDSVIQQACPQQQEKENEPPVR